MIDLDVFLKKQKMNDVGTLFDRRYALKEKLGDGGYSTVWVAHDTTTDTEVALKIFKSNGKLDEQAKEDFRCEYRNLIKLNHTHIIHTLGGGIYKDELPYLVLPICHGGAATQKKNATEEELWQFAEQVASGLAYLHRHRTVHQDIKPDNVLINDDGQYVIIDLGISTKTRQTLRPNQNVNPGGTTWYMSPESFEKEKASVFSRDIWALGASLYELMTGDVPFGEFGGLTQKAKDGKVPSIESAGYTDRLKQLVYDCLAMETWDRPSAEDVVRRCQGEVLTSSSPPAPPVLSKKLMLTVMFLFVITGGLWGIYRILNSPEVPKVVEVNSNDSILAVRMDKALALVAAEKTKGDYDAVSEDSLASAAMLVEEAMNLDATDTVKTQYRQRWHEFQDFIDETYSYLYGREEEYNSIGATSAASEMHERCKQLQPHISSK